jgi:hypothetical protein
MRKSAVQENLPKESPHVVTPLFSARIIPLDIYDPGSDAFLKFSTCRRSSRGAGSYCSYRRCDDEANLVELRGHTHPLAVAKYDEGAVEDGFPMPHMFLQLRRGPEQEAALEAAIDERQDPHSANYHQWLTAEKLGTNFGPAQQDIETVSQWLTSHGLQVNAVSRNGLTIDVSGSAGQVREAFHTEIRKYIVNGKQHIDMYAIEAYPATAGWDFATGLGSIDVSNLVNSWPSAK